MLQKEEGGLLAAKQAGDRLLAWGLLGGVGLGVAQFFAIPLLGVFTPLADVQEAARLPAMMAAAQQVPNPPTPCTCAYATVRAARQQRAQADSGSGLTVLHLRAKPSHVSAIHPALSLGYRAEHHG